MSIAGRLFRSGFIGNLGVGFVAQVVQLAIQLALVPIFSLYWGLETYGVWLILFTVPGYLAMADLGILPAAANVMAQHMARGDRLSTLATYQALRLLVGAVNLLILIAVIVVLFAARPDWLDFASEATGGEAALVVLLLAGYGLLTLQNGVVGAAYRASNLYVEMGYASVAMIAAEAICAMILVVTGHGIVAVAIAYFTVRLIGTLATSIVLIFKAQWLLSLKPAFSRHHLTALIRPALASIALPLANAITFQGMVIAVGAAAGSVAVPLFTTARTLTRSALQFTLIVSRATMPVYTVAAAQGDEEKRMRLLVVALSICVVALVPTAILFAIFGQDIILLWTGGEILVPHTLVAMLALAMVFGGLWGALGNAFVSTNQHGLYAYANLAIAALSVGAAYLMMMQFGIEAAGIGPLLLDLIMFCWLIALSFRLRLATRSGLVMAMHSLRVTALNWMVTRR